MCRAAGKELLIAFVTLQRLRSEKIVAGKIQRSTYVANRQPKVEVVGEICTAPSRDARLSAVGTASRCAHGLERFDLPEVNGLYLDAADFRVRCNAAVDEDFFPVRSVATDKATEDPPRAAPLDDIQDANVPHGSPQ